MIQSECDVGLCSVYVGGGVFDTFEIDNKSLIKFAINISILFQTENNGGVGVKAIIIVPTPLK